MPNYSTGDFRLASELPPDIALEAQGVNQRQRIADLLIQHGFQPIQPPEVKGRFQGRISPWQGVAQLAKAGAGAFGTYQNQQAMKELGTQYRQGESEAANKVAEAMAGTPERRADYGTGQMLAPPQQGGAITPETQFGAVPMTPAQGPTQEQQRAILANAMLSHYPRLQKYGEQGMAHMNRQEDRAITEARIKSEGALTREAHHEGRLAQIESNFQLQKMTQDNNLQNNLITIDVHAKNREQLERHRQEAVAQENKAARQNTKEIAAGHDKTQTAIAEMRVDASKNTKTAKQEIREATDAGTLMNFESHLDRLAVAAEDVINHPGLEGITGVKGAFFNIPGSKAADAAALMETLKSQVGFGVLRDMRENSKTGGALGQVSDFENKLLQANIAALEKPQSLEQMKANVQKIVEYAKASKERYRKAYHLKYPDTAPSGDPKVMDTEMTKSIDSLLEKYK